eukprot:s1111_g16.t1
MKPSNRLCRMKPFHPSMVCIRFVCLLHATTGWWGALSSKTTPDDEAAVAPLFLQVALETGDTNLKALSELKMTQEPLQDTEDVVFMHIPYNFGHTIEKVAFLPESQDPVQRHIAYTVAWAMVENETLAVDDRLAKLQAQIGPSGRIWGRMHPALHQISNVTGCPLYFTPGKYWPQDVAERYFQQGQRFGLLRDPYERLVAMFRGDLGDYGGGWGWQRLLCEVDSAIKKKMEDIISGTLSPFAEDCTFVPQAEFFDGPHGITHPVDNRYFPLSANEFLKDHGHASMHIDAGDIMHVEGCNHVWAGDLSCETKALVRQVYARDFELLCTHFGHCDVHENVCLEMVQDMSWVLRTPFLRCLEGILLVLRIYFAPC